MDLIALAGGVVLGCIVAVLVIAVRDWLSPDGSSSADSDDDDADDKPKPSDTTNPTEDRPRPDDIEEEMESDRDDLQPADPADVTDWLNERAGGEERD
ncbi:MAG: hypothetical protein ACOCV2_02295 [Persicimonas sp.]